MRDVTAVPTIVAPNQAVKRSAVVFTVRAAPGASAVVEFLQVRRQGPARERKREDRVGIAGTDQERSHGREQAYHQRRQQFLSKKISRRTAPWQSRADTYHKQQCRDDWQRHAVEE